MLRVPSCLHIYLKHTSEGDRNTNLFNAMKRVRHFYPEINQTDLQVICSELNTNLNDPLNETEVLAITKSVHTRSYPSTCYLFKDYCQHCKLGTNKKTFKDSKKDYWKFINEKNYLKRELPTKIFLWDILDLETVDDYEKEIIQDFRAEKGINPLIDTILKNNKIPVGDEALNEFLRWQDED